jgi:hypothetical protein
LAGDRPAGEQYESFKECHESNGADLN